MLLITKKSDICVTIRKSLEKKCVRVLFVGRKDKKNLQFVFFSKLFSDAIPVQTEEQQGC